MGIELVKNNSNIELKSKTVNLAMILEAYETNTNEILEAYETNTNEILISTNEILNAIGQAVFDKQLFEKVLNGECEILESETITGIADYCFYSRNNLKAVNLKNCNWVGERAFSNCVVLKDVELPIVQKIEMYAFYNSLITKCNFPLLTEVGANAFASTSITEFIAPNIISIGDRAFENESALTTISEFPNLTNLGQYAFSGCTGITEFIAPKLTTVGTYALKGTNIKEVNFPYVTNVPGYMFNGCKSLESVNMTSAKTVATYVFSGCSALVKLSMPLLENIGANSFVNCSGLTKVSFPEVKVIDSTAFSGCSGIVEVDCPKLTTINFSAFKNCSGMKKIWIPESCTQIIGNTVAKSPFNGCDSNLKIFCEVAEKPSGWNTYWNYYGSGATLEVVWGATYEDFKNYSV